MKNILITGGAGFIGSNLALKLIEKNYKVYILDNLSEQIHGKDYNNSYLYNTIKDKVIFIKGSVLNREDWLKSIFIDNEQSVDYIIHLAAETGTGQSMYEIEKYTNVNIGGTAILLDILTNIKNNVKKIVVASSRSIYGEGKYYCPSHQIVYPKNRKYSDMENLDFNMKCPICNSNCEVLETDENSSINSQSIYALTKQVQEEMCMLVGKNINIPVVAFRYQNVYGPGQSLKNPYTGILSIFSTRIKNENDINIFEDGKESRDFVYIDDVVQATILGLEKDEANFESFNVGSGNLISVLDVANTLKKLYNSNVNITISGNYRLGDIKSNIADLTKIKNLLGYKPEFSFEKGIKNFINWVNSQEIEKDNYEQSIVEMKKKGLYK